MQVLLKESRSALLLFLLIVIGGAFAFYNLYRHPDSGAPISFVEALYASLTLLFFQGSLDFPQQPLLQLLYFIIPGLGLLTVVEGVVRFGVALTNKQSRGQNWQVALSSTYSNHVVICGMGKVGYRVALELMKFEREIVAIEKNPDCRFLDRAVALGIPVIIADARRVENLLKTGIERADALIPCTDDELTNLDIALDGREINPSIKIVMRMFDPDLAARIEKGFGIHTAYSVSALAAPTLAAASMRVNVKSSFYAGDKLLHISEFTLAADSKIAGWAVQKIENELNLTIVSLTENGVTQLHPDAGQMLKPGCQLLALGELKALERLEKTQA